MYKVLLLMPIISIALAHEGHHHGEPKNQTSKTDVAPKAQLAYQEIQGLYLKDVKPIFDMKCAACHSSDVAAPSYAAWPVVGWIVNSDRSEAKEHLEISRGFPFAGHGTPEEDLNAIKKDIEEGDMPTFLYRVFHPSSRISNGERITIIRWVAESQKNISAKSSDIDSASDTLPKLPTQ